MALHLFESSTPGDRYLGWLADETLDPEAITGITGAFGVVAPASSVPTGTSGESVSWDGATIVVDAASEQRIQKESKLGSERKDVLILVLLLFLWRIVHKLATQTPLAAGELSALEDIEAGLPGNATLSTTIGSQKSAAILARIKSILEA